MVSTRPTPSIKDTPRGSSGNPAEKRAARPRIGAYRRVPPTRRNRTCSPAERGVTFGDAGLRVHGTIEARPAKVVAAQE
jgi:hypothetical protein